MCPGHSRHQRLLTLRTNEINVLTVQYTVMAVDGPTFVFRFWG